jgi:peptide/nickel transport system permease protein
MPAYLMSRLFMAAWVSFGVTSLVFFLIHWVSGDPIEVMLGESASGADREALRHALGLDRPVLEQWLAFLSGVLSLDLGNSLYHARQRRKQPPWPRRKTAAIQRTIEQTP